MTFKKAPKAEMPVVTTESLPFSEESEVMEAEIPAKVREKAVKPAKTVRTKK